MGKELQKVFEHLRNEAGSHLTRENADFVLLIAPSWVDSW
jgi:hypothetical protein